MLNNVVLMGRLTATPVLNQTQSGALVTSFAIAIDRRFKRQGEERQTDFINCVAWQKTAEFISKYFKKGDAIAITGEIQTRKYEDKDTGKPRTATEVVINNVSFCGNRNDNVNAPEAPAERTDLYDDDLPF